MIKNENQFKPAAIWSVIGVICLFVLFYFLEGKITLRPIALSIACIIMLMIQGWILEKKRKKKKK